MPYLDIRSSKPIDGATRNALQLEIGKIMPVIPGKNVSNTLICFMDSYTMFKENKPIDAVFVDIRMYKSSQEEDKKEFVKQFTALLADTLGIPPAHVQLNFIEQPNWAVNGDYF